MIHFDIQTHNVDNFLQGDQYRGWVGTSMSVACLAIKLTSVFFHNIDKTSHKLS